MVWTLTLQPESEGPSLISYAARLLSGGHSGLLSAPSWRTVISKARQVDVLAAGGGELLGEFYLQPVKIGSKDGALLHC